MARLLREPLLHFFLIGIAIFALHALLSGEQKTITVSSGDIQKLRSQWQVPLEGAELAQQIEQLIREEVLYREALNLGLEKDDVIIRRRLVQKMRFLLALPDEARPSEAAVRAFHEQNSASYRQDALISFSQIFFSENRDGEPAEVVARQALTSLNQTAQPARALGDQGLFAFSYQDLRPTDLDRLFGGSFSARLTQLPATADWQGPLASVYGLHLIRVDERKPPRDPPLAEIRELVGQDLLRQQTEMAIEKFIDESLRHYEVHIEGREGEDEEEKRTGGEGTPPRR